MNQEYQTLSQDPNQVAPSVHRPDTEVVAVAKRRQFSSAYNRRIVSEAAACDGLGAIGELLRREGLYSSHLATWRRELEAAEHAALSPKRRGPARLPVQRSIINMPGSALIHKGLALNSVYGAEPSL